MRGEAGKFVGMRTERQAAEFADFARGALGKFGMGVEAGADGGATDREIIKSIERLREAGEVAVEQTDPAGKFLFHTERCRVLQMGAADFDDAGEFFGFGVESVAKFLYGGGQSARGFCGGGAVEWGGGRVFCRLLGVVTVSWVAGV